MGLTPGSRAWRKLRETVLNRDGYSCAWCGEYATTLDHIIERDRGGTDHLDNLVAACTRCNSSRGARYRNQKQGRGRRPGW